MHFDPMRALALLRAGASDPSVEFREAQEEAIRHVVEGRGPLLVVQRTGWGKSFVYFIATKLLREAGAGPALLVSPLLALMRNQLEAARRMGLRAEAIHSDNRGEWREVIERIQADEVDLLLISPERLGNEQFNQAALQHLAGRVSLVVIDEAHCVSDWGHDFRPHYRLIQRTLGALPKNVRVLATTATANHRVSEDLKSVLGAALTVRRGPLGRPSLKLQTIGLRSQAERLAWLADRLVELPGSGIIYTLTVRDARLVADWLSAQGHVVAAYSGESEARPALEDALLKNDVKALIATTALGMGFDKPDLGFVVHFQAPGSPVAYYQQVGRAGRAVSHAYGVLLSGAEDDEINDYFIRAAFPSPAEVQAVLDALDVAPEGLTVNELTSAVNISRGRIERTLLLLSLESPAPIVQEGARAIRTIAPLAQPFWERARRLTELRRAEQQQMSDYARLTSGHMEFLISALDGEPSPHQGPALPELPTGVSEASLQAALTFLRRTSVPIEPRRQWPSGGLPTMKVKGRIKAEHQAQPGRALCVWGDAGWGALVKRGKYRDGHFPDELVKAAARLVQEDWRPDPPPEWVTCVPSARHPDLVPDLARRIAAALGLPFALTLGATGVRPEQKHQRNSAHQAKNLDGAFALIAAPPPGPALLIDDMVDSRWTLTVAAYLLRAAGAGDVYPLALSVTLGDE